MRAPSVRRIDQWYILQQKKKFLATKIERETERERGRGGRNENPSCLKWAWLNRSSRSYSQSQTPIRLTFKTFGMGTEKRGKKTQIPIHRAVKISHKWQVEDKHYQRLFLEGWLSILISQIDLFIKIRW